MSCCRSSSADATQNQPRRRHPPHPAGRLSRVVWPPLRYPDKAMKRNRARASIFAAGRPEGRLLVYAMPSFLSKVLVPGRAASFTAVAGLLLCGIVHAVGATMPDSVSVAEQYLLAAANQERVARGLPQLHRDPQLARAAAQHARLMAEHGGISHQRFRRTTINSARELQSHQRHRRGRGRGAQRGADSRHVDELRAPSHQPAGPVRRRRIPGRGGARR